MLKKKWSGPWKNFYQGHYVLFYNAFENEFPLIHFTKKKNMANTRQNDKIV